MVQTPGRTFNIAHIQKNHFNGSRSTELSLVYAFLSGFKKSCHILLKLRKKYEVVYWEVLIVSPTHDVSCGWITETFMVQTSVRKNAAVRLRNSTGR